MGSRPVDTSKTAASSRASEYAEKKRLQMEKARRLREERKAQQAAQVMEQPPPESDIRHNKTSDYDNPHEGGAIQEVPQSKLALLKKKRRSMARPMSREKQGGDTRRAPSQPEWNFDTEVQHEEFGETDQFPPKRSSGQGRRRRSREQPQWDNDTDVSGRGGVGRSPPEAMRPPSRSSRSRGGELVDSAGYPMKQADWGSDYGFAPPEQPPQQRERRSSQRSRGQSKRPPGLPTHSTPQSEKVHERVAKYNSNPAGGVEEAPVSGLVNQRKKQSSADIYAKAALQDPEAQAAVDTTSLIECSSCGRKFNENAYEKHSNVCRKVFQTKRKAFDSTKHRVSGTEAAQFVNKTNRRGGRQQPPPQAKALGGQKKWKQQHEAFQEMIRANRQMKQVEQNGGGKTGFGKGFGSTLPPPPPPTIDPSFVQCPTCGRSFNPTAAERHIPQCKNIINKPKRLERKSVAMQLPRRGGSTAASRGGGRGAPGRR